MTKRIPNQNKESAPEVVQGRKKTPANEQKLNARTVKQPRNAELRKKVQKAIDDSEREPACEVKQTRNAKLRKKVKKGIDDAERETAYEVKAILDQVFEKDEMLYRPGSQKKF